MSIYEKELEEVDEIFNEVKQIVENASLGSKVEIVRMFSAAKREYEQNKIIDALRQKVGHEKSICDVIVIDEKSGIIIRKEKLISDNEEYLYFQLYFQPVHLDYGNYTYFKSFDEALIGLVCMKHKADCAQWISRMIGINSD